MEDKKNKWLERSERWQKRSEQFDKAGKNMSKLGGKLTIMFTVPILLAIFFGVPGFIIGIVIAIVALCS
ncbi:hypothetical protein ADU78_05780 [Clostridium botulinum]|uniref:hypothetical protein n=1 Tax=Clostridium botulinum TaxID=1491 RepID=UPI00069C5B0F|nr:hypothetical protein [Clostridium botulinum]KOA76594.1 hypothetical protein ADU78_05780 [Clostridium botulinum]KOC47766.1 hypothetical protein ADU86_03995 [Clostridium botulinum]